MDNEDDFTIDGQQIKCPFCPVCGTPPTFIALGLSQAWCPNDDCEVLLWVPWDTAKQNLEDSHLAEFTHTAMDNSEYEDKK